MKKSLLILAATLALAGCATDKNYQAYLTAQDGANRQAQTEQKPLVRLTAQPGQAITGLQSLEVYTPAAASVIQQARPNEWAGVVGQALNVVGTVAGIRAAGQAAVGLADSVGRSSTTGYQYVQAAPTITTTTDRHDVMNPAPVVVTPVTPVVPTVITPVITTPPVVVQPVVQVVPVGAP